MDQLDVKVSPSIAFRVDAIVYRRTMLIDNVTKTLTHEQLYRLQEITVSIRKKGMIKYVPSENS